MIPATVLHKGPLAAPISTMNPHYSQSQPPQNNISYSESLIPTGFINPFAPQNPQTLSTVENASASVGPHPDVAGISVTLSSATTIQALQPFTQGNVQSHLNLSRQRLQRQSFDISMLPLHTTSQPQMQTNRQSDTTTTKQPSFGFGDITSDKQERPPFCLQGEQTPRPMQQDFLLPQVKEYSSSMASTSIQPSRQSSLPNPNRGSIGIMSVGSAGISDIALLLSGAIKLKTHITGKPPYSYATLITYAIMNHPRKQMTLNEIYSWVMEHYPYFKTAGSGWKNSIRHNLSLSKTFVRIPRPINEPGKGAYWTVDLAALEATMNNQPKPPTLQFQPLNEQQLCNASRGSVITPCYPPAQPGIPAVLTQGLPAGSITAGSFAMGMTSSISEMGLLQNAPSSESAIALRRASLQVLPTHGRFQPYPAPGNGGLGRNRSQYHDLVPSPPHMQQILGSLNPFAMPISASTFGSANRRFQLQNPGTALGISTNTGPQPALPTIPTATDRNPTLGIPLVSRNTISTVPINLSSSSIHGSPADPVSSSNKPFSGALRQNGQAGGSSKDESTIKSASLDPKPKESTQRKNNEDYGMRSTQLEPTCKEIGHKSQEDHTDIEASGTSENTPGNDLLEYFTFGDT